MQLDHVILGVLKLQYKTNVQFNGRRDRQCVHEKLFVRSLSELEGDLGYKQQAI